MGSKIVEIIKHIAQIIDELYLICFLLWPRLGNIFSAGDQKNS